MYDTKQLENLSYVPAPCNSVNEKVLSGKAVGQPKCGCELCKETDVEIIPASVPPKTLGFNSHVIKPESRVNSSEVAEQPPEPIKFPEMCENTKKIIKACKLVVQAAEDYDTDTMTTPVTVVQACEQLNCVLERMKREAEAGMKEMGFEQRPDCKPEQSNLMIITAIECLFSQVNDRLCELRIGLNFVKQTEKYQAIDVQIAQALEDIDLFQKTTLFELRKAFE
jgi:hypothetical protein